MKLFEIDFRDPAEGNRIRQYFAAPEASAAVRAFAHLNPDVDDFSVEKRGPVGVVEIHADGSGGSVNGEHFQ